MKDHTAIFYLIAFHLDEEAFLKIGVTRTAVETRYKSGYRNSSRNLIVAKEMPLYEAFVLEQQLLLAFSDFQMFPKQNNFVGKTECLSSSCISDVLSWLNDNGHGHATHPEVPELPATSPNSIPSA